MPGRISSNGADFQPHGPRARGLGRHSGRDWAGCVPGLFQPWLGAWLFSRRRSFCRAPCATAQMHSEEQLNAVAQNCGLSVGEVMQDASEKSLLFL